MRDFVTVLNDVTGQIGFGIGVRRQRLAESVAEHAGRKDRKRESAKQLKAELALEYDALIATRRPGLCGFKTARELSFPRAVRRSAQLCTRQH